jgi:hypothetical protein
MENKYELILTISNHGYSKEIMETAKLAGARGGTIMHGRSSTIDDAIKFLGITILPEKDIILIVTTVTKKKDIMLAISSKYGANTEAHGLCFSLPVDEAIGFNF